MSDIKTTMLRPLAPGQPPGFDWLVNGPSLGEELGLESAIILSLFTDRRANDDDVIPDGTDDRRGWWANPELGSRLWLLSREKELQTVVVRAHEYCTEALQWLINDGYAYDIDIITGWVNAANTITETRSETSQPGLLGIGITVHRPRSAPESFRFTKFWEGAL